MLKELQEKLPKVWTDKGYSPEFRKSKAPDKRFRHALLHAQKALGKLVEAVELADHEGVDAAYDFQRLDPGKYLADLVICAARMAQEYPLGDINLDGVVRKRLERKMGLKLKEPK